jgi:uncharacterized protein (DUF58 family)
MTSRLATNVFAGEYKSVFKGRGLEFQEVREYAVGDEIRMIDWNVTARMDRPFIKNYTEERELTIMIMLDASRSGYFGSVNALKKEIAAEVSAILAASAAKNNDRVGLIIFTDRIEKFIPPRKGRHHILRIIRDTLYHEPSGSGTDIPLSLQYLDKVTTRSTVAFIISDFYASGIKKPLSIAGKRHDIVALRISDPRDYELPRMGIITLSDAESGRRYSMDTSMAYVREKYALDARARAKALQGLLNSVKIDTIEIGTQEPYIDSLIEFFKKRRMRRRLRG